MYLPSGKKFISRVENMGTFITLSDRSKWKVRFRSLCVFVSKVYEWFGVDNDRIPLIGNSDGKFFIDSKQIIALDRKFT